MVPLRGSRGRRWTAARRFHGWLATWAQGRRRKRVAAALPAGPIAPGNLSLADVATWIELTWQDRSGDEQGFRVYRKVDGGSFALWQSLGPNVTTTQDVSVLTGHNYSYYVTAYNAVGESAPSNTVSETYGA
jgi:hypothetical protein